MLQLLMVDKVNLLVLLDEYLRLVCIICERWYIWKLFCAIRTFLQKAGL